MAWLPEPFTLVLTSALFLATYAGVALGGIPGLALDRTGIVLLGAIAMVATGGLTTLEALHAIDAPTILLLYALMVVAAQFRVGGFYTRVALSLGRFIGSPPGFLAIVMGVTALLSAILVNDVICLAFTPVLAVTVLRARLNPAPFLIGLALASNIGSAATIIGNPQNMLLGQVGRLAFGPFLAWCAPPALAALAAAYGLVLFLYRGRLRGAPPATAESPDAWPAFNRHQSVKGLLAAGVMMALFFTRLPRELTALSIAGILLCSRRMRTRDMLELVDWHLLTLFCGLFIVIGGLEKTGLPALGLQRLADSGVDIHNLYLLTGVSAALSNLVSNVPAVMLLINCINPGQASEWRVLALASTFAGNLFTLGSIANLIVIEQARQHGIRIGFREHARVGVPVTLASLGIVLLWIWLTRAAGIGAGPAG